MGFRNVSPPLQQQLETIATINQQLSEEHRLGLPAAPVVGRLREVLGSARVLFQDWTLEICYILEHEGTLRYGQLRKRLVGISTRTLAAKLAQLQQQGLVARRIFREIPPHVEYALTERGRRFTQSVFPVVLLLNQTQA
ncbi:MAG: helix-turn-helix transcriptional regulator [Euryarchaeota archaeon]|nr:helix-turn-helix transcriptional regulator [Euryarchaeota archaeon]